MWEYQVGRLPGLGMPNFLFFCYSVEFRLKKKPPLHLLGLFQEDTITLCDI